MLGRRWNFAAVAGMLILSATVHADMMPVSPGLLNVRRAPVRASYPGASTCTKSAMVEAPGLTCEDCLLQVSKERSYRATVGASLSGPSDWPTIIGILRVPLIPSYCDSQSSSEPKGQTQSVQVLGDEQSSLSLAMYALISLGLFRSGVLVKKLSFRLIPDWYHDGGPLQVGHSLAISPDCLCSAPVHCFVQPDCGVQEHTPRYHHRAAVVLWRKSQFLPMALAPRGPPCLVHRWPPAGRSR